MSYFLFEDKICVYEFVFTNWCHDRGLDNKGDDSLSLKEEIN